ncbi:MAG: DUF1129 domain-containing protein [Anaerolineae bacterium]|nr:DUF1129 domain-containing protein [Anaerolineae bacterium]
MNEFIDNLPSLGKMFKLIIFLVLALIVFFLVAAIVKVLIPVAIIGAIIFGVYWFVTRDEKKKNG